MSDVGPWERTGLFVYALTEQGTHRGEPFMVNRFTARVDPGHGCSPEEAESVAKLMCAAKEMADALEAVLEAEREGRRDSQLDALAEVRCALRSAGRLP